MIVYGLMHLHSLPRVDANPIFRTNARYSEKCSMNINKVNVNMQIGNRCRSGTNRGKSELKIFWHKEEELGVILRCLTPWMSRGRSRTKDVLEEKFWEIEVLVASGNQPVWAATHRVTENVTAVRQRRFPLAVCCQKTDRNKVITELFANILFMQEQISHLQMC